MNARQPKRNILAFWKPAIDQAALEIPVRFQGAQLTGAQQCSPRRRSRTLLASRNLTATEYCKDLIWFASRSVDADNGAGFVIRPVRWWTRSNLCEVAGCPTCAIGWALVSVGTFELTER